MEYINNLESNDEYKTVEVYTNEGKFIISFCRNLDLYWMPSRANDKEDSKTYFITKDNMKLYDLFLNLYNDIKNQTPYKHSKIFEEDKNKKVKPYIYDINLFHDNMIEWHSDDFNYDDASVLTIEKTKEELFKINFKSSNKKAYGMLTKSIRFRNSGSLYDPYNITFMEMYHDLVYGDIDYNQVYIDDLERDMSLKRTKKEK